jgi:hypothetical protein
MCRFNKWNLLKSVRSLAVFLEKNTKKMAGNKRTRLINAESDGAPISTTGVVLILVGLVVVGLIAATITLGVLYGQAAQWPKNTTTTTNLLFPAPTRRRIVVSTAPSIDPDTVATYTALDLNLTNTVIETASYFQMTTTIVNGTLTGTGKKKRAVAVEGIFDILLFFPAAHPATSIVNQTITVPVVYDAVAVSMLCTVDGDGTTLHCSIVSDASLFALNGAISNPTLLSYVINK